MTTFPLTDRFVQALQLAHQWHSGQYRKGTAVPYVSHLLGVASIALEFGASEDEAIAALLHDALEDGPQYTGKDAAQLRTEIASSFGEATACLVEGATDATPKVGEKKTPWVDRKTTYLRELKGKSAAALLVSASDKLHNARTILSEVLACPLGERAAFFQRFQQGQNGTLQYYRLLSDAYRQAPATQGHPRLRALTEELERVVAVLETACTVDSETVRHYGLLRGVWSGPEV